MGIDGIFDKVNEIGKEIFSYFNSMGHFYMQVQMLCRLLVVTTFLDDLFEKEELTCDTKQVGCEQNCINRYAPLNHQKIWQFEFFLVMLCLTVFSLFASFNKYAYKKWVAKMKKQDYNDRDPSIVPAKSMGIRFTNAQGVPIYDIANAQNDEPALGEDISKQDLYRYKKDKFDASPFSKVVQIGYIVMLILRAFIEYISLKLELNLGRHQSQKAGLLDSLTLKEMWYCPTNVVGSEDSTAEFFPVQNRSLFWTDELNEPCVQQKVYIACWIPFSRMKTWGLYFMYYVLILCFCITIAELCLALFHLCTRFGGKAKSAYETDARATLARHQQIYHDHKSQAVSITPSIHSMEKQPLKQDAFIEYNAAPSAGNNFPAPYEADTIKYPLPDSS